MNSKALIDSVMPTENEVMRSWRSEAGSSPVISIMCFSYNHEKYIKDAIDGFLIQKTEYPFEIIVHDDASEDSTTKIIQGYVENYPNIIKLVAQSTNQYSKGEWPYALAIPHCSGEFTAVCEGDDYWTDPSKLQEQVSFLRNNPEYSFSSHSVEFIFDGIVEDQKNYIHPGKNDFNFEEVLRMPIFMALNSLVYRTQLFVDPPVWVKELLGGHKALIYILSSKGMVHHFHKPMAVKRRNPGGITVTQKEFRRKSKYKNSVLLLEYLKKYLNGEKDRPINVQLRKIHLLEFLRRLKHFDVVGASSCAKNLVRSFWW